MSDLTIWTEWIEGILTRHTVEVKPSESLEGFVFLSFDVSTSESFFYGLLRIRLLEFGPHPRSTRFLPRVTIQKTPLSHPVKERPHSSSRTENRFFGVSFLGRVSSSLEIL